MASAAGRNGLVRGCPAARARTPRPHMPALRGPGDARSTNVIRGSQRLRYQAPSTEPRQRARVRTHVDTAPQEDPNRARRRDRRGARKGRAAHVRITRGGVRASAGPYQNGAAGPNACFAAAVGQCSRVLKWKAEPARTWRSPQAFGAVPRKNGIGRNHSQIFDHRLSGQQTIKRISMMKCEPRYSGDMRELDW